MISGARAELGWTLNEGSSALESLYLCSPRTRARCSGSRSPSGRRFRTARRRAALGPVLCDGSSASCALCCTDLPGLAEFLIIIWLSLLNLLLNQKSTFGELKENEKKLKKESTVQVVQPKVTAPSFNPGARATLEVIEEQISPWKHLASTISSFWWSRPFF